MPVCEDLALYVWRVGKVNKVKGGRLRKSR